MHTKQLEIQRKRKSTVSSSRARKHLRHARVWNQLLKPSNFDFSLSRILAWSLEIGSYKRFSTYCLHAYIYLILLKT